jgi:hypothetical protein
MEANERSTITRRMTMKPRSVISAVLFITVSLISAGIHAADDKKEQPAAEARSEKVLRRHSHQWEKIRVRESTSAEADVSDEKSRVQDRTKHFHPRDKR